MSNLAFFQFQGQEIREHKDLISVVDVIKVLGNYKSPRKAWSRLKEKYPNIATKCHYIQLKSKNGRLSANRTPMANKQVILEILGLLPGEVGKKYREEAAKLFLRYLEGDASLAVEIFERIESPEDQDWVKERISGKIARKSFVNNLCKHGIRSQSGFANITNNMTKLVTGKTATQLKEEENVAISREVMTKDELYTMKAAESLSSSLMNRYNVKGYNECSKVTDKATRHILDYIENFSLD